MAKMRLTIGQDFVDAVNNDLSAINGTRKTLSANEIGMEALAVYKWFVKQTAAGKAVVSANKNLDSLRQVSTPNVPAKQPRI